MPATPIQTSVNAGELSPRLGGRPDLAAYQNGTAEMLNIVPLVQGPALKRSGTRFVERARDQAAASRLLPFVAQIGQAYVIEASAGGMFRFFTSNGRIEIAGVPVELAHPYDAASLAVLDYHQSNDVMYLADGVRQQRRLSRTGATTFALTAYDLTDGPFKDLNSDETVTVYASAGSGSITLTASMPIFLTGHIGALFYLEIQDFRDIAAWEPGISVTLGALRRNAGKVYLAVGLPSAGGRTGSVAPVHIRGRERDGMGSGTDVNTKDAGGVLWEYQYGKFGIVRITAIASTTSATGTVLTTLPANVVGAANASWRWAHAAFSDAEGWPGCVTVWNERLVFAKGNGLYASVVGDFSNFAARNDSGEATADQALLYKLAGADPIQWIVADRQLLVGTRAAEYAIGAVNPQAAVHTSNITAPRQSYYGSAKVRPVQMTTQTMFVQRAGRKLREMGYNFQADRYLAPDLTVRADHISRTRLLELAVQQEPESLVWGRRGDGVLASMTYSADQEVKGWSRHILGGWSDAARTVPAIVESMCAVPDPAGEYDQLWVQVQRRVNGAAMRSIERLEAFWANGSVQADGFFVDCGLSYAGPPVATFSGLGHLAGEQVALLVDGATHPRLTVTAAGTVTLANGATGSTVHIGLPFTARLTSMRLEAGGNGGTAQGKLKRIVAVVTRFLDSLGVTYGTPGGRLDQMFARRPSDPMDRAPPLNSGDTRQSMPGGWDRNGQITFESSEPLPMTVLAWMPEVQVSDR